MHPVDVAIADGRLVTFVVRSPKRDDLRRGGRFALHATPPAFPPRYHRWPPRG